MLLLLSLTLPLNASIVSAASGNLTTADTSATVTSQSNTENTVQTSQTTSTVQTNNSTTDSNKSNNSSSSSSNSSSSEIAAGSAAGSTTTIKVLIYSGTYASSSCVNGLKTALDYANANNLIPGVQFTYATSTVINSATLAGYDVLNLPGGDGGYYYLHSSKISISAIKSFVANGGGYLGICAGAYAAVANVDGWYSGMGLAPHINAKVVGYIGNLSMQITSTGQDLLDRSGTLNVHHYNGAAMYVNSGSPLIIAKYADSKTGYKGYADIIGDYYGNGRTVLIGSHLELDPQYPDILANLIAWAANVSTDSTNPDPDPDPDPVSGAVTLEQISSAASNVKSYFDTNSKLPNYVTVNSNQITTPQFLYLLATGTIQANSGSAAAITVKSVNSAPSPAGTFKSGNIAKSEFLSIAQNIKNFIENNGRAPNYITTSLGKINYNSLVYMYSKIMNYYKTNNRLPNYVSMAP